MSAMSGATDQDILGAHFVRLLVPRFLTRKLGNDDSSVQLSISAPTHVVRSSAEALAGQLGEVIETEPDIVAKVGTGSFRLNPAVLRLRFSDEVERTTSMEVAATAKEGLIKQHGGHQAVAQFVDRFRRFAPMEWAV
jgi:hypothetical protein